MQSAPVLLKRPKAFDAFQIYGSLLLHTITGFDDSQKTIPKDVGRRNPLQGEQGEQGEE
jgi:hypothetical protein